MENLKIEIVNIVTSIDLKFNVNLERLASMHMSGVNIDYDPDQFPATIMRLKEPRAGILVFSTGKLIITGLKTFENIEIALKKAIGVIEKTGIKIIIKPKINITNLVAISCFNKKIDLNKIAMTLDNVEYEPEQFPGLIYKINEPHATFLLFSTSKVVCTGLKDFETIKRAVSILKQTLKKNNFI